MEGQTAQNPTSEPALTPVQVSEPKTKLPVIYLVLSLLILVFLASTGYFYYQNIQLKNILANYQTQATPTPSATPDSTADWKTYKVGGLGIELKLPGYLSPLDYPNGNETKGEKGKQFCIEYTKVDIVSFLIKNVMAGGGACFPQYFGLGTTSVDYEAGRSGGFGDLQGYTFENGKYFAKMVLGKRFEIPAELAKEITNPNGIKILRVVGKNSQPSEKDMPAFPIAGTPGDGRIGALINLGNNATYSGVSVEMKLEGKLNTELFDQILSTFKFTN